MKSIFLLHSLLVVMVILYPCEKKIVIADYYDKMVIIGNKVMVMKGLNNLFYPKGAGIKTMNAMRL